MVQDRSSPERSKPVLLINPNTSSDTTQMMGEICRRAAPGWLPVETATASSGPTMILDEQASASSAEEVLRIGMDRAASVGGIVVGAFGDPASDELSRRVPIPVVGICEASMREAALSGRRFGVTTVTPGLVEAIGARAHAAGLAAFYTGVRLTEGDPLALTRDPDRLREALAGAIAECTRLDGAEAVIIGGGPLAQAAEDLQGRFDIPIIAPLPAAIRLIVALLQTIRREPAP